MSPEAAKELKKSSVWTAVSVQDVIVVLCCTHGLAVAATALVVEKNVRAEVQAQAEAPKPTPVAKTDWSTFDCAELKRICWSRAKQRVAESVK